MKTNFYRCEITHEKLRSWRTISKTMEDDTDKQYPTQTTTPGRTVPDTGNRVTSFSLPRRQRNAVTDRVKHFRGVPLLPSLPRILDASDRKDQANRCCHPGRGKVGDESGLPLPPPIRLLTRTRRDATSPPSSLRSQNGMIHTIHSELEQKLQTLTLTPP